MPFNKESLLSRGAVVFGNPLYTAIIATIVVMIIVIIIFHNQEDTMLKKSIKATIYIFVTIAALLFIHNHSIIKDVKGSAEEARIMSDLHGGESGPAITGAGEDIVAFPEIKI